MPWGSQITVRFGEKTHSGQTLVMPRVGNSPALANIGWRRGECKRRRGKSPPCGEETTAVVRLAERRKPESTGKGVLLLGMSPPRLTQHAVVVCSPRAGCFHGLWQTLCHQTVFEWGLLRLDNGFSAIRWVSISRVYVKWVIAVFWPMGRHYGHLRTLS